MDQVAGPGLASLMMYAFTTKSCQTTKRRQFICPEQKTKFQQLEWWLFNSMYGQESIRIRSPANTDSLMKK
jgi:hypothetical protein